MHPYLTASGAAKAYVTLAVSLLLAGLTAWQQARTDGLAAADLVLAVAVAVLIPLSTWLAPRNAEPPAGDQ
jgi:hypothetical protein